MKKWMSKFVEQINLVQTIKENDPHAEVEVSEELATLLFLLDSYGKNLIETDTSPVRRVREALDEFSKELLQHKDDNFEKTCFRLRQFFSSHRIEEYTYVQKSFDEFRKIIWEFVDHLSEDMSAEQKEDTHLSENVEKLREAVESNSIELLKTESKDFINSYVKIQHKKEERKAHRISNVKKNLNSVKKQLVDANNSLKLDHLTKAFNRRSFDEQLKQHWNMFQITKQPISMIMLDIDFFKRVNDTYGHAIGDLVLVECVKMLKELFPRDVDSVSRIGGEEFAVLLPDYQIEHAIKKAEAAGQKIRTETILAKDVRINFTVSMGIAQLIEGESFEQWMKRADLALYESKKSGRDRYTVAPHTILKSVAAS